MRVDFASSVSSGLSVLVFTFLFSCRAYLSQSTQQWEGKAPEPPPQPEVYTTFPDTRNWILDHPLIPSALSEEHRHLSSDVYLRPEAEWGKPNEHQHPKDVNIFIGVFTGVSPPGTEPGSKYDYAARRDLIRSTWMGVTLRYKHVAAKFVVGLIANPLKRQMLEDEERRYGDFMHLPEVDDEYNSLGNKTRHYFRHIYVTYPNVDYIIKIDDDVLILPERLLMAADQWSYMKADYIGCALVNAPLRTDPKRRWFQPLHWLLGRNYPLYFSGCAYALRGSAVRDIVMPNFHELRTSMEDVQVSWWMLASDVVHFEDRRLCRPICDDATVAMYEQSWQGFPMQYWHKVMSNPGCSQTPKFPLPYVPTQHRKYPCLGKMHELMV